MNMRETSIASVLLVLAIVFGIFPAIMIDVMEPSVKAMAESAEAGYQQSAGQVNQLQAQR
jgi:NADH:ubiquinone oxidoreductase subunit 4 (subunit M)